MENEEILALIAKSKMTGEMYVDNDDFWNSLTIPSYYITSVYLGSHQGQITANYRVVNRSLIEIEFMDYNSNRLGLIKMHRER